MLLIIFRNRCPLRKNEVWFYAGNKLDVVDNFNYLGTVFNYTGTFVLNQQTLAAKGLKSLNVLMHNVKQYCLKPSLTCQLFDSFVGATLNHSCEVWGFGKTKVIERIHLKFCKMLLNVKTLTSNMGVYGELGRYPVIRQTRIVKYWCRILLSENVIVVKLYQCLLNSKNTKTWAHQVKHMLDDYRFSYVWTYPASVDLNKFHMLFKERALDVFKQN